MPIEGGQDILASYIHGLRRKFNFFNKWNGRTDTPENVNLGGQLIYDGHNSIYALRGDTQQDFWRYSINENTWALLTDITVVSKWGSLAYDGGDYIYAIEGNGTKKFRRYSISGNSWAAMTDLDYVVGGETALAYDGGDYIYAINGNVNRFSRYSITGNSWTAMATTIHSSPICSKIIYDGDDYIYYLTQQTTGRLERYSITGNSWTRLTNVPANLVTGATLTGDNGDFLYIVGNLKKFWRYSIKDDAYVAMASLDEDVNGGNSLEFVGNSYIFYLNGDGGKHFYRYII